MALTPEQHKSIADNIAKAESKKCDRAWEECYPTSEVTLHDFRTVWFDYHLLAKPKDVERSATSTTDAATETTESTDE